MLRKRGRAVEFATIDEGRFDRGPGTKLREKSPSLLVQAFDLDAIANEGNTVRAAFVNAMRSRIAEAAGGERPELETALRYGLLAFAKKGLRA